ncbi:hypothetical protein BU14_0507s0002 [Porphyra umbilicalis]|uniref:Uncharacterized protein n=1 Tax=Porphyra umbilicalis TaxID=2786 RepID=A0A1X6NSW9_PORUM|nr:hypothetical protein BU14_0507s0002 [Porphyra umbilicalis]|eukprot:OSX71702.1 hypothetical protein BU14_0507s0002 [Porphyra umbilicalis]
MLPRLPPPVETSLKLPLARRDDKQPDVCLGGAPNHVRHKVLMPRRVEDGESPGGGGEGRPPALLRFTLGPLLVGGVERPRKLPALPVLRLCLLLKLLHRPLVDVTGQVQDVARDGALPSVDVANKDQVGVLLPVPGRAVIGARSGGAGRGSHGIRRGCRLELGFGWLRCRLGLSSRRRRGRRGIRRGCRRRRRAAFIARRSWRIGRGGCRLCFAPTRRRRCSRYLHGANPRCRRLEGGRRIVGRRGRRRRRRWRHRP